ncbi:MAG: hypothetical protein ACPGXZ_03205 [Saprospiraceae bacterium]
MKQIFAISMSLLFLMLSMKDMVVYVSFKANQDYIVDNFCENKIIPQVMCNGSCYLADQLESQNETKENAPLQQVEDYKEVVVYIYNLNYQTIDETLVSHSLDTRVNQMSSRLLVNNLFRPPMV